MTLLDRVSFIQTFYLTLFEAVCAAVRNILWDWQSLQPSVGPNATFFQSCDAIEVKDGANAPAGGWGLSHALPAFGAYFKNIYLPARTFILVHLFARDCDLA